MLLDKAIYIIGEKKEESIVWEKKLLTDILITSRLMVAYRVSSDLLKERNYHFFSVFLNRLLKHVFNIVLKLNNYN